MQRGSAPEESVAAPIEETCLCLPFHLPHPLPDEVPIAAEPLAVSPAGERVRRCVAAACAAVAGAEEELNGLDAKVRQGRNIRQILRQILWQILHPHMLHILRRALGQLLCISIPFSCVQRPAPRGNPAFKKSFFFFFLGGPCWGQGGGLSWWPRTVSSPYPCLDDFADRQAANGAWRTPGRRGRELCASQVPHCTPPSLHCSS